MITGTVECDTHHAEGKSRALIDAAGAKVTAREQADLTKYTVQLQTVVVDARGHMLGRLASIVAKQLLNGQHVVSGRARNPCRSP